jgi:hypothetical protein
MFALAGACFDATGVSDSTGVTVSFALTDAPIDESLVTEVNVTVSEVAVNESTDGQISDDDGSWKVLAIEPAVTLNLLALQNGLVDELGALELTGGTQINQIRLGVDAVEIVKGGESVAASMPSKTGLKIVNAFTIPLTGAITITIDFDVRKSIVEKPHGTYMVKPVLRAIVDNEAGKITGTVTDGVVTVHAYANDSYEAATEETATADDVFYSLAYTSANVAATGLTYTLAFLEAGTYDLYGVDANNAVVAVLADVVVAADKVTVDQVLVATP